ncbi:nucleotidyltransferase domain-containing protein [Sporomusa sphaeroides]|uniref:Nucleotidyltransferase n=1 Tax=Sporomusa sphaeroides DSM 2875 TaxID=1337886 RepID=A0ABP2C783_9FIRM|nr:nucleotidyltransferase domain-containing protein [Sporomusa sphaeroides]OLS56008.1 putative nucleotidyltransferase [Sporomusa sphaeroides DSM 2875]CVK20219.1 putative nucleotidyltransferase [Sporomusa sphaeroides DSM 2875]
MRAAILAKLTDIETEEKIKILFAVESGSRAWGFPSPDSDYDVRFVYIHRPEWYLSIEKKRDVLEYPIHDLLDINGWDIRKALGLLRKYNPALMEWLDSPIVYREENEIREQMKAIRSAYFARRTSMFHYLSMAVSNYRSYLKGETVKAKKYFYVLRPLFACMWLERENTHPPLSFHTLLATQMQGNPSLQEQLEALLARKMAGDELSMIPRMEAVNRFIEERLTYFEDYANRLPPDHFCDMEQLNSFFRSLLHKIWAFDPHL